MKKWTEVQARKILQSNGAMFKGKTILSKNGLNGLSTCSALDYLVNYCGYRSNL